ncbi:MAG: hypothetical protein Ct9H300mP28_07920 [Pseudomonadota bacterium]|nr:MAG: hypothetical protein Ct9H300mP28_07920 [Pseudomonadota bacterium]
MDRDNNWEKVEAGWNIHVQGKSEKVSPASRMQLNISGQKSGIIDQDIPGFVIVRTERHSTN